VVVVVIVVVLIKFGKQGKSHFSQQEPSKQSYRGKRLDGDRMAVSSQFHPAHSKITNISLILRAEFCQVFGLSEMTSSNLVDKIISSKRDKHRNSSNQCKRRTSGSTQLNKSSRKARV